ncbi:MAG: cbb3-type cytochrome c oxidase subunit II [Kiloniellales bacterium]
MSARFVALVAGVGFFFLALVTQGILPLVEPESRTSKVTAVVRTDFGELKWMVTEATDYTEAQARGRAVYIREGCWYCHSQFVRPVTGETRRWGPVSQAGEYAFDTPHLFSTRRIGPDLTRVGLKYSDEWHLAHFWDPRMVVPDSIMPRFAGLFERPKEWVKIVEDSGGRRTLEQTPVTGTLFDFASQQTINLTPNAEGLLFVPLIARDRYPVILTPNDEYTGEEVQIAAATQELDDLIDYLQKLGMNRGKWRDLFEPQRLEASIVSVPRSDEWIDFGREVYEQRCAGCHGVTGDGNGPAATFMYKVRPRDFNLGVFKFKLVKGPVPHDGDLLRTITRGIRGTAMPPWHALTEHERQAVIQYIKYELAVDRSDPNNPYAYFVEEPPGEPLYIPPPPPPSEAQVARGKDIWQQAKCWECHGDTGKGDGEKAPGLKDDFGYPIPPADLTTGQFKSGPAVEDMYRTISTGMSGTPMPSYRDAFPDEDRWALSYYILSLSAFTDPLTGEPLQVAAEVRAALNDPQLKAASSAQAYAPPEAASEPVQHAEYAGEAWAERRGIEVVGGVPQMASTADAAER